MKNYKVSLHIQYNLYNSGSIQGYINIKDSYLINNILLKKKIKVNN